MISKLNHLTAEEIYWWRQQEGSERAARIVSTAEVVHYSDPEVNEECAMDKVVELGQHYLQFAADPDCEQVELIQAFLKRFRPCQCVAIAWDYDSDADCGGGACLITADEVESYFPFEWAEQQVKKFYRRQRK